MSSSIAFITDMHIAPVEAGNERAQSKLDRPARRAAHLRAACDDVNRCEPEVVLFGGDNANQPVSRPAYRDAALELMQQIDRPWHAIPGNHDVGSCVGWHHHDPDAMTEACHEFTKSFGPDHWNVEAAGFRVIGINSQISGSALSEAKVQLHWLGDQLSQPSDLLTVVFLHTPLYLQVPTDNFDDGSEQMCLRPAARKPILDALDRQPPDLIVTAHSHRFWQRKEPRWDWVGLPATAFGKHEMTAVPSDRLPPGDDAIGWVELFRKGDGYQAVHHKIADENPPAEDQY